MGFMFTIRIRIGIFTLAAALFAVFAGSVRAECGDYVLIGDSMADVHASRLTNEVTGSIDDLTPMSRPCHGPNCGSGVPTPAAAIPIVDEVTLPENGFLARLGLTPSRHQRSSYHLEDMGTASSGYLNRIFEPPQS